MKTRLTIIFFLIAATMILGTMAVSTKTGAKNSGSEGQVAEVSQKNVSAIQGQQ